MHFLVIIPARKNSKRLRNKNLLKINNKEIIRYSFDLGIKIENANVIVVSDSNKIIKISKKYRKIDSTYVRPKKNSQSKTSMFTTVNSVLGWYENKYNKKIDHIILLQPTSPYRNLKHIKKIIEFYKKNNLSSLTTVSQIKINNNCILQKKKHNYVFSKNKYPLYRIDGSVYICSKYFLKKYKKFSVENKTYFYLNENQFSIDIDYQEDFLLTKLLMESNDKK